MPQRLRDRLKLFVAAYLLLAWWAAWAAIEATGPNLLALPWAQAGSGVVVTWLGGLPATLGRKMAADYTGKRFDTLREFLRDLAVSIVLGLAGYLAGMSQSMSAPTLALSLLLIGYSGTRALEVWASRILRATRDDPT